MQLFCMVAKLENYKSNILYMSHGMRKPVYATCKQQRRRSACADAQSVIPLVSIPEISSLYVASESTLVENPEDRFSHDEAIFEFLLLDWQLKEKLLVLAL